jgi:hypothetical protein
MNDLERAAYEAGWNTAIAAQNAAWIAKWGLPPVDPGTAARATAKDKEWAEFLQAKTAAALEAKFQAAHDRAEKQLANNRRIFHDR